MLCGQTGAESPRLRPGSDRAGHGGDVRLRAAPSVPAVPYATGASADHRAAAGLWEAPPPHTPSNGPQRTGGR